MKPILILQHIDDGGPGLFAEFLRSRGIAFEIRRPDRGDAIPEQRGLDDFAGFCLCGGTQGANDLLPWLGQELELIRAAAGRAMPVIGHCLGGQLISKALGGEVLSRGAQEFGWQTLRPVRSSSAAAWLNGAPPELVVMHWHQDSFSNPPGAEPILTGEHCRNQAFVLGNMLGMQFHVEVTEAIIRHWAVDLKDLVPRAGPGVQSPAEVLAQLPRNFAVSWALAESLYTRWLEGC